MALDLAAVFQNISVILTKVVDQNAQSIQNVQAILPVLLKSKLMDYLKCKTNSNQFELIFNSRCKDPCPGVCALNAECRVINHNTVCTCMDGYEGEPSSNCRPMSKYIIIFYDGPKKNHYKSSCTRNYSFKTYIA